MPDGMCFTTAREWTVLIFWKMALELFKIRCLPVRLFQTLCKRKSPTPSLESRSASFPKSASLWRRKCSYEALSSFEECVRRDEPPPRRDFYWTHSAPKQQCAPHWASRFLHLDLLLHSASSWNRKRRGSDRKVLLHRFQRELGQIGTNLFIIHKFAIIFNQ